MQSRRISARDLRIENPVFTADGQHIGFVKEIRQDAFKIDAPWRPDYWVSCEDILSAPGDRVTLDVDSDDLDDIKRGEPQESDIPDRYRARAYGETWEGPGPDYMEPAREWERAPREPAFSYGSWEQNRPRSEWDEPREPFYRDSSPAERRPARTGQPTSAAYYDDDRSNPRRSDFGKAYRTQSRYRSPAGIESGVPRYDQERGWGYQGQGGWNQRMGAPGTYSAPRGARRVASDQPAYSGQPGRGYDRETWGEESQWYDTEAPRGYSGRGPRGYSRPDESICDEVCERLTQAGMVDASDIDVNVEKGEVILTGEVDDRTQKRVAEDVAWTVPGVRDIRNEIRARRREGRQQEATMYLV